MNKIIRITGGVISSFATLVIFLVAVDRYGGIILDRSGIVLDVSQQNFLGTCLILIGMGLFIMPVIMSVIFAWMKIWKII